jgi:hypothetical protein
VGEIIALEAEDATLREAVLALSEAVPFTLVERGASPEAPVSLRVEANTWQGFFRRLLGRESHLLTLDRATGKPTQLVVRWDAVRELQAATPEGGAGDVESRIRAAAGEVLAPSDVAGEAIARMEEARDTFEAARGGPNEAEAREAYLDAIDDLNTHDEARTVEALVPALAIDDRDARLAGLETLRELSHTARTPAAVDAAMSAFETADTIPSSAPRSRSWRATATRGRSCACSSRWRCPTAPTATSRCGNGSGSATRRSSGRRLPEKATSNCAPDNRSVTAALYFAFADLRLAETHEP